MPKIRIGLSTDFNLVGEQVGIGTTNPTSRLDVAGQILADNTAGVGGISTFREYQGFHQTQSNITNNVLIDNGSGGPFSSLSGEIKITGETTVSSGSTVEVGKTKTLTVTDKFAVPLGDTNSRDNTPEAGTTRFNQDFGTLEFFDGTNWKTVNSYAKGGSSRGYFSGGAISYPGGLNAKSIDLVNIQSTGGAVRFGDLSVTFSYHGSCASSTRGVVAGNYTPQSNAMEYFTLATEGSGADFGDQATQRYGCGGCGSSTRGLFGGGYVTPSNSNIVDYITIPSIGNALDFGDLTKERRYTSACSSPVRGVWLGGISPTVSYTTIDYVTIASLGNALDFGDCLSKTAQHAACSNSIRGIASCSAQEAGPNTQIQSIMIATTGNAIHFGDLSYSVYVQPGFVSDQTRGVHGGGFTATPGVESRTNMAYVSLTAGGLGVNFGDLTVGRSIHAACSDSHGGLGGF